MINDNLVKVAGYIHRASQVAPEVLTGTIMRPPRYNRNREGELGMEPTELQNLPTSCTIWKPPSSSTSTSR